jgi:hypothetical protein
LFRIFDQNPSTFIPVQSHNPLALVSTYITMADLDAGNLFSVKGLVAVITGGGTGKAAVALSYLQD